MTLVRIGPASGVRPKTTGGVLQKTKDTSGISLGTAAPNKRFCICTAFGSWLAQVRLHHPGGPAKSGNFGFCFFDVSNFGSGQNRPRLGLEPVCLHGAQRHLHKLNTCQPRRKPVTTHSREHNPKVMNLEPLGARVRTDTSARGEDALRGGSLCRAGTGGGEFNDGDRAASMADKGEEKEALKRLFAQTLALCFMLARSHSSWPPSSMQGLQSCGSQGPIVHGSSCSEPTAPKGICLSTGALQCPMPARTHVKGLGPTHRGAETLRSARQERISGNCTLHVNIAANRVPES